MNLLARRAQIKLASDGITLLKAKREALLKELLNRARVLRDLRRELHRRGRTAVAALAIARATSGTPDIRSAAVAGHRAIALRVKTEKIWGLELSDTDYESIVRSPRERGIGVLATSSQALDAMEAAESMLEQLIECAPFERNIQVLGDEVRKVSRRINALDESLLPRLREDVRHIGRALEEREREDVFRLKRIKQKKAANKRRASGDA
jgi:V/A-type H+-transporting ATPase subunit D